MSTGRIPKLICLLFAGINVAAVVVPLVLLVLLAVLLAAGFFYYKRQVDHFDTGNPCLAKPRDAQEKLFVTTLKTAV